MTHLEETNGCAGYLQVIHLEELVAWLDTGNRLGDPNYCVTAIGFRAQREARQVHVVCHGLRALLKVNHLVCVIDLDTKGPEGVRAHNAVYGTSGLLRIPSGKS